MLNHKFQWIWSLNWCKVQEGSRVSETSAHAKLRIGFKDMDVWVCKNKVWNQSIFFTLGQSTVGSKVDGDSELTPQSKSHMHMHLWVLYSCLQLITWDDMNIALVTKEMWPIKVQEEWNSNLCKVQAARRKGEITPQQRERNMQLHLWALHVCLQFIARDKIIIKLN